MHLDIFLENQADNLETHPGSHNLIEFEGNSYFIYNYFVITCLQHLHSLIFSLVSNDFEENGVIDKGCVVNEN